MVKLTYISITVIVALMAVSALAAPYQELVPKPGHVAVYIREGDTALSEIHPKLAEAFHEEHLAKIQIENKTPEIVLEVKEDKDQIKEQEKKDKMPLKNDDLKAEKITASDIAEFDDVKSVSNGEEPQKIEKPIKDNKQ